MQSFDVGSSGCKAKLPRVRVGVIRHQGETMLSPSHDVVPFLKAQVSGRWDITPFDERDFGGALGGAAEFDVIVLGYNATLYTPELRAQLEQAPPTVPILLMHQREQECFAFLRNELELTVVKLGGGVRETATPRERADAFEPLLNWPNAALVRNARFSVKAICALSYSPDGAWRVVMEAQRAAQRFPVLVRTRSDHPQRMVACSLLLQPAATPEHGRLLENLLVYCAFGWPDVGLVELKGDRRSAARVRALERGMAMWTKRNVRVTIPSAEALPLDVWPLQGVKRVVAPAELSAEVAAGVKGAAEWFRRGGELIRVADDHSVTVTARLTDRFIVIREWAMWFGGVREQVWVTRLSLARAVLRMLDAIARTERDGLPLDIRFRVKPTEYDGEIAELLAARVAHDNVEETISATASALDVDRLTGGSALSPLKRLRVERWLTDQLQSAGRADQLDILRCLADRELLGEHLRAWGDDWHNGKASTRIDALVATRLREAVHACWPDGDEPEELLPPKTLKALDGKQVVEDLHKGPLLCADFLAAVYSRGRDDPGAVATLFDPARYPKSVAAAVERVHAGGLYRDQRDVRAICAHTLAILRHLERHPAGLRFLAERGELPASVAESVLEEATEARHGEREARRDLPALGMAVLILATVALAVAVVGLVDLWRVAGVTVTVQPWWLVAVGVGMAVAGLAALYLWVRRRYERREQRELRLGQSALAVGALVLTVVAATLAWRVGAEVGIAFAVTLAPVIGATALGLLLLALRHFDLMAGWASGLPSFSTITAPVAAVLKKLTVPRLPRS